MCGICGFTGAVDQELIPKARLIAVPTARGFTCRMASPSDIGACRLSISQAAVNP